MSRLALVSVMLVFLFIQLASSQDACQDAIDMLTANAAAMCTSTEYSRICESGECRDIYDSIFDICTPEVSGKASDVYS